jgi:Mn2+/Fe2+ NRAMP family transporter
LAVIDLLKFSLVFGWLVCVFVFVLLVWFGVKDVIEGGIKPRFWTFVFVAFGLYFLGFAGYVLYLFK